VKSMGTHRLIQSIRCCGRPALFLAYGVDALHSLSTIPDSDAEAGDLSRRHRGRHVARGVAVPWPMMAGSCAAQPFVDLQSP
jgi:hypothetical protein